MKFYRCRRRVGLLVVLTIDTQLTDVRHNKLFNSDLPALLIRRSQGSHVRSLPNRMYNYHAILQLAKCIQHPFPIKNTYEAAAFAVNVNKSAK
jgi:hypothetical protein